MDPPHELDADGVAGDVLLTPLEQVRVHGQAVAPEEMGNPVRLDVPVQDRIIVDRPWIAK